MRIRLLATTLAVAAVVSACGSSSGAAPSAGADTSPPAATPSTQSPAESPSASPSSSSATSGSVPVSVVTGSGGRQVPVVDVSVAGGSHVRVVLDTGSTGLVLASSDVGSSAHDTSTTFHRSYVGFTLSGRQVMAPVAVLGGSEPLTTGDIAVGALTSPLTSFLRSIHAAGIMGVAPGQNVSSKPSLLSPLAQLPGSLADGYVVDLAARRLDLGAPSLPGGVSIPLHRASWSYPDGLPGYAKAVSVDWTVGGTSRSLPTVFDTGGGQGIYDRSLLPSSAVSGSRLAAGTSVRAAAAGRPVVLFTAGRSGAPMPTVSGQVTVMNTGEVVFAHEQVGVDLRSGRLLVDRSAG